MTQVLYTRKLFFFSFGYAGVQCVLVWVLGTFVQSHLSLLRAKVVHVDLFENDETVVGLPPVEKRRAERT